ncbi:MAG: glycosyltransferase family 4 protein [Candidatus Omnitrophica bacterium]|nr:glycosyltransferase family 4 protein [Candidatus Omnitrophota bacterium]
MQKHDVNVVTFFSSDRNDWLLGTTLKAPNKENSYIYDNIRVKQIFFNKLEKFRMLLHVCTYYFNKMYNIGAISKLIEKKLYVKGSKIDLIHNVRVGREPLSYASYNLAKALNIPFIFTPLHHPRWTHSFYREYHELYRKADALFALTTYEKEIYKRLGVKDENIFVTGTGPVLAHNANPEDFRSKYGVSGNMVLFIGQGYPYKGLSELVKAAKVVLRQNKNVHFIFIGPHTKYSHKLFLKIRDPRIRHLGAVDLQAKTDALAACDIFCLPSSQESFGAVFLEAWLFQKPVIAIDIPQLRELIEDKKDGYLLSKDPDNIARAIINLLQNPDLRKEMGNNGRKKAEDNFTWDALNKKTLAAYDKVLARYL